MLPIFLVYATDEHSIWMRMFLVRLALALMTAGASPNLVMAQTPTPVLTSPSGVSNTAILPHSTVATVCYRFVGIPSPSDTHRTSLDHFADYLALSANWEHIAGGDAKRRLA